MSAVKLGVGAPERAPLGVVVLVGSVVVVGLWGRVPWWIAPAAAAVVATTLTVRVGERTAAGWLLAWHTFSSGKPARAQSRSRAAILRDVEVAAGECGVRVDGSAYVAMIQLAPNLDLPTVVADRELYTEDTVPVADLLPMLDQFGIGIGIDIVTTGQRVRPAGSYTMLYDQLIGHNPVVGDRMTWLVLRLDPERNLAALTRRGPAAEAGPRALASAAHRISARLRERGISALPLPADAMGEAIRVLHTGVELSDLREHWNRLESSVPSRGVTSYVIDWPHLDATGIDDCWSWNRGRTTVVVSLAEAEGARGLVRFVGPEMPVSPPDYLRPLPGRQSDALLASLVTATSVHDVPGAAFPGGALAPADLPGLTIAVGPSGQILGSISGRPRHALAMPLFDPVRYNPRRRSIDVYADLAVAQQIILRALVVGADVEVHSARPQRWQQLVAAVGDPASLRLISPAEEDEHSGAPARIAVYDHLPAQSSSAHTTVTIQDPGTPRGKSADLAIDQISATEIDVTIPMRTVRVDLIEPRGETKYLHPAAGPPVDRPPPAAGAPVISAPDRALPPGMAPPGSSPNMVVEIGSDEVGR